MALGANKAALLGAAGSSTTSTFTISQSIRFNSADSAYMHRTPSSSGNRKTFTSSFWVKFGDLTDCALPFPSVYQNASYGAFLASGIIQFFIYYTGSAWQGQLYTNRVFRDPSAWYHFVIVVDTTNAIAGERVRIYVNGQRETSFSTENYPNLNQDTDWNNSGEKMGIGVNANGFGGSFGEYCVAEMVYIDGTAYGPENFGETNDSGIWVPKDVSGLSFGTNGFHVDGRDSSDLGDDESGQGNDLTVVNLASNDQLTDSPTNNFCTLNPIDNRGNPGTLSEGNLKMAFAATNDNVTGTFGMSSGKWYWEAHIVDNAYAYIGVQDSGIAATGYTASAVALYDGGFVYENNSDTGDRSTTYTNGDVVGVAFDADNKKIWWSKNGQWYSADDSSTTTINISEVEAGNQAQVITRSPDFFMPFYGNYTHSTAIFNFGQEGTFAGNETAGGNSDGNGVGNFFSAVPSGFLALCTKNLGS